MNTVKALLTWKNKSLLTHAVTAARDAHLGGPVVVVGAHKTEVTKEAASLGVNTVLNLNWQRGMGSSIKVGLYQITIDFPKAESVLIQLCDQPLITGESLLKLLTCVEQHPDKIVAAAYAESVGVPAVFPKNLFEALMNISDHMGAKKLILEDKTRVIQVSLPEGAQDIDTPEQFNKL